MMANECSTSDVRLLRHKTIGSYLKSHCSGCVKFEFNSIALYTKNNSECSLSVYITKYISNYVYFDISSY